VSSYAAPTTIEEALAALAGGGRIVAGGTDLVVGARQGKAPLPEDLVAIHRVGELRGISRAGDGLRIGALASHADVVASEDVQRRWTALADAAAIVGSPATRGTGTIGGNIVNASPAADTVAPLICLEAIAEIVGPTGTRREAVDGFATGPGRTILARGELLVALELPAPAHGTGSCYVRLEFRRQMEIAVVGAAAVVVLDGGRVREARIAMTALAPTIRRVPEAEAALVDSDGGSDAAEAAGRALAAASKPISDVRAPADYRHAMAAVVARRAVLGAVARAAGRDVAIPASDSLFGSNGRGVGR
jgi:CO/xanthine dehydrogenase FAD-binding subunit